MRTLDLTCIKPPLEYIQWNPLSRTTTGQTVLSFVARCPKLRGFLCFVLNTIYTGTCSISFSETRCQAESRWSDCMAQKSIVVQATVLEVPCSYIFYRSKYSVNKLLLISLPFERSEYVGESENRVRAYRKHMEMIFKASSWIAVGLRGDQILHASTQNFTAFEAKWNHQ